jgi:hypothetical protein
MKKFLLVPMLALVASQVFAQKVISVHASMPLFGTFSTYAERPIGKRFTILARYQIFRSKSSTNDGSIFFPLLSLLGSSGTETYHRGHRWGVGGRIYLGDVQNSAFLEMSLNRGKHNIKIRTEKEEFSGFLFFIPLFNTVVTEKKYDNVRVSSIQWGIGYKKKVLGPFSVELSTGIVLNNTKMKFEKVSSIRETTGYLRLSGGLTF